MSQARRHLLLDTNILVIAIRGGHLADVVDKKYGIRSSRFKPLVSIVSIGELLAIALRRNWGAQKRAVLEALQRELVIVNINSPQILNAYAEVQVAAESSGRTLSKNDLWIAATAKETGATLLTTDRDFDALDPDHIDHVWIDQNIRRQQ